MPPSRSTANRSTANRSTAPRVKLPPRQWFLDRCVNIPGFVWRKPPFKLDPPAFAPSSEKLASRIIESETMTGHYKRWVDSPHDHPMIRHGIYGVASEPSDDTALCFAAHLVHQWMLKFPDRRMFDVKWAVFGSEPDFKLCDDILQGHTTCDLLVLTNLTPNSSPYRLQKARDLVAVTRSYPAIVVVAGEDPISFFSTRLYAPLHSFFFQTSKTVVRRQSFI